MGEGRTLFLGLELTFPSCFVSTSGSRPSSLEISCHCDGSVGVDEPDDESPTPLLFCISCDEVPGVTWSDLQSRQRTVIPAAKTVEAEIN